MEFLAVVNEVACVSRVLLDDKPLDCDARVYHQSHGQSVSVIAVFADQQLGGSLGASFGCAAQFGRSGKKGSSLGRQIVLHRVHENVTHLTFERPIVVSRAELQVACQVRRRAA